jgi:hypothetical protein
LSRAAAAAAIGSVVVTLAAICNQKQKGRGKHGIIWYHQSK